MAVRVDQDECISCFVCMDSCPEGALDIADGSVEVDDEKCLECGICLDSCPMEALSL